VVEVVETRALPPRRPSAMRRGRGTHTLSKTDPGAAVIFVREFSARDWPVTVVRAREHHAAQQRREGRLRIEDLSSGSAEGSSPARKLRLNPSPEPRM